MNQCKACNSTRIVFREATQEFRCRKCGYSEKVAPSLSKRVVKKRNLSETTRMRISNSMSKAWRKRKKDPIAEKAYREAISKAMSKVAKGKAQQENSV